MTASVLSRPAILGPPPVADDDQAVSILVVDDNPAKRFALKAVLLPLGYSIVEADSGLAALRCVMAENFAVILLDVRMPVMDGSETAALIRQRRESEMTPIIFFTAHTSEEIPNTDRYAEGAVDFIFAPLPPEEIRAKVSVFANIFIKARLLAGRALEVEESAAQLRLLMDAAPIGIFRTDVENRYLYTNPRWSEITGIAAGHARGREWDFMIGTDQPADCVPLADSLVGTELSRRFEMETPGSPPRTFLVTSKPIPDVHGGITGWAGTLADISAEVGAEAAMSAAHDAAREASRLKSDFLANMSHEIRTPMNGVIGMTDLLLETDLDTSQRDYAQTVRNSGDALLTIIDQILDFSKVEAGMVDIENIDFDVPTVVQDVVDLLAGSAEAKGLGLAAVIDAAVPLVVTGDPGRVRQVLTNLIGNAIKFTQSGEIVVRVTLDDADPANTAGTVVRFQVTDTGDGIEPDKIDLIFQPFAQADTSTTRRYGGTGLGLAISARLVALLGGDCGVLSKIGEGSTFWFTIRPDADAGQADAGQADAGQADAGQTVRLQPDHLGQTSLVARAESVQHQQDGEPAPVRLLLAEDNPINQKVAVAMLAGSGYVIDTVSDGAAAVAAVIARPYDIILMDCQMPGLSGYEATAAIRAHEGSEWHTPIIALTAGARREDRERCLAEGMDSYLAKPLRKGALLALVAKTMSDGPTPTDAPPIGHPGAAEVMIDPEVLDELFVLGEVGALPFLADLVDQFVRETEPRLVDLREAMEAGDADDVIRIAHIIQGSGCQLGGRRLALSCGRLENKAATGLLGEAAIDLQGVEIDYHDLCRALTELMEPTDR
ncbi:MAG: two-component system, sensor histidine kinase and response regulator [Actinomycetota bacterium]|nr:two-component system, sensor histidine kinase and response regulator [Actinomycetota bacterium]